VITRKLLIVEDNPGDVTLIGEALEGTGIDFQVQHCETAIAALQLIRGYEPAGKDMPDVILLDYNLPAGTALDILGAVKGNPALSGVKTAVVTCSVAPRDREQALAAGADLFVYKPSDFDQFMDSIRTAVLTLLDQPHCTSEALSAGS
jgi:CheY-like chemotaxis protein